MQESIALFSAVTSVDVVIVDILHMCLLMNEVVGFCDALRQYGLVPLSLRTFHSAFDLRYFVFIVNNVSQNLQLLWQNFQLQCLGVVILHFRM